MILLKKGLKKEKLSNVLASALLLLAVILFLTIKINFLTPRFSDSNFYFYLAHHLGKTGQLYKDFFFTNLPLFPYFLHLLHRLGLAWHGLQLLPAIQAGLTTIILFLIIKERVKNNLIALLLSVFYLSSFTVLATSDYETGIHLATLFLALSFYWGIKNHPKLAGLAAGLAVTSKIYLLPILICFFIWLWANKQNKAKLFLLTWILTTLAIVLPFLIRYPQEMVSQIFVYNLKKPAGTSKLNIIQFFLRKELGLIIAWATCLITTRKRVLKSPWLLCSAFFFIAFLIQKDVYYLYLLPVYLLMILFTSETLSLIKTKSPPIIFIAATLLGLNLIFSLKSYFRDQIKQREITNLDQITSWLNQEKNEESTIYGDYQIVPLLSLETDIPIFRNLAETNQNLFRAKALDKTQITKNILNQKNTFVVLKMSHYPELKIEYQGINQEIINWELLNKNCRLKKEFPLTTVPPENTLVIFYCP